MSCFDSRGNDYSVDSDVTYGGRLFTCSAHGVNALFPGDTISATYPGFSGPSVALASEFLGPTGLDQGMMAFGYGRAAALGPIGTATSGELLVSAFAHAGTAVFSLGCDFVPAATVTGGRGSGQKTIDLGYRVVNAAGNFSACGVLDRSARWQGALLAYR